MYCHCKPTASGLIPHADLEPDPVTASPSMNSPVIVKMAVIANAVKQSMTSDCMDRHGPRPRDDANNTVIARNVVTWQSVCGIGPDTGGVP